MSKSFRIKRIHNDAEIVFESLFIKAADTMLLLDSITIQTYPVETGSGRQNGGYAFVNHNDNRVVFVICPQAGNDYYSVFKNKAPKGHTGHAPIWYFGNLPLRIQERPALYNRMGDGDGTEHDFSGMIASILDYLLKYDYQTPLDSCFR